MLSQGASVYASEIAPSQPVLSERPIRSHGCRRFRRGARTRVPLGQRRARSQSRRAPCQRQAGRRGCSTERSRHRAARYRDAGDGWARGAAPAVEGASGTARADGLDPHQAQCRDQLQGLGARCHRLSAEARHQSRNHHPTGFPPRGDREDQGAGAAQLAAQRRRGSRLRHGGTARRRRKKPRFPSAAPSPWCRRA